MLAIQSPIQVKAQPCLANTTVFVVEPDRAVAEVLAFMLESEGAEVQIAHEFSTATRGLAQAQPNLLICNLKLPDGDGYSLLRHCQQLNHPATQQMRAIAIAHSPWKVERQKAISSGFHQYLFEPMEYSAVMVAIAQALQNSQ